MLRSVCDEDLLEFRSVGDDDRRENKRGGKIQKQTCFWQEGKKR